jgi:hypothetical protein
VVRKQLAYFDGRKPVFVGEEPTEVLEEDPEKTEAERC